MKDLSPSKPHIGIIYPNFLPDTPLLHELEKIKVSGLQIEIRKQDPEPWAAMEWAVPTLAIAIVFKSYFESFLSEAGKDHYLILKKWLSSFARQNRLPVRTIVSSQSPQKITNQSTKSKSVSIVIQTTTGRRIKLLFDNNLHQSDWDEAINSFLDHVIEHYKNPGKSKLNTLIKDLEKHPAFEYYAVFDNEIKSLVIYDSKDLVRLARENESI